VKYEDLFEEWWIEPIFGNSSSRISRQQFVRSMEKQKKLEFIFSADKIRKKFKSFQIKYDQKMKARNQVFSTNDSLASGTVGATERRTRL